MQLQSIWLLDRIEVNTGVADQQINVSPQDRILCGLTTAVVHQLRGLFL
jgi:hypothetical protein